MSGFLCNGVLKVLRALNIIIVYNESMEDKRNLVDSLKGLSNEEIKDRLSKNRNNLEIAIYNIEHDFNFGSIVRTANSFNVAKIHIIGRRKYNRRGAMCTDKYMEILYWEDLVSFVRAQKKEKREIVAIENNVPTARGLVSKKFVQNSTLLFGGEGEGLPVGILEGSKEFGGVKVDDVRLIESFGSTRSVNVGVAAGIAMYEWVRQVVFEEDDGEEE